MKNYNLGMLKAAGWAAACAIGLALPASAAVDFLGVAAGDASNTEATLWTRAVDPNAPAVVALTAQVSTNYDFGSGVVTYAVATDAAKDFTAKVTATGLSPLGRGRAARSRNGRRPRGRRASSRWCLGRAGWRECGDPCKDRTSAACPAAR